MKVSSEDLNPEASSRIDADLWRDEDSDLTHQTPDSTLPNFNTSGSELNNSHQILDSTETHLNSHSQELNKNQKLYKPRLCVNNAENLLKSHKNKLSDWLPPQWHRWIVSLISGMLCSQSDEEIDPATRSSGIASSHREKNSTHARLELVDPVMEEIAPRSPADTASSDEIARIAQSTDSQVDFLTWYSQVPKTDDGVLDVPHRYLPTDRNKEPLVRIGRPDPWLRIPYTLMPWRSAMAEFPLPSSDRDLQS